MIQNIFTFLRIAAVAVLVVLGLSIGNKAGVTNFDQLFAGGAVFDFRLFGLALIAVLWTYDGFYSVSCTAEEVKKPAKKTTAPKAKAAAPKAEKSKKVAEKKPVKTQTSAKKKKTTSTKEK